MAYEKLKQMIDESDNIVFLGGAGVSTESDIPDFRSVDGLYNAKTEYGYSPETLLSKSFFNEHTDIFFDYYKKNLIHLKAKPNMAHFALARLEEAGKLKAIITQNIDNLHTMAGSQNVIELHGSVMRNHCVGCNRFYSVEQILKMDGISRCECGGIIKPDVVLYEESLNSDDWDKAYKAISEADMLIVGGTSLMVYPAAGLISLYKGNKLVLINKGKTKYDDSADIYINEKIGQVLSRVIR